MNKFLNRPLTPHLTIYSPQSSSLFSIWHRFSAIVIILYFFVFTILQKIFSTNIELLLILYKLVYLQSFLLVFIDFILFLSFFYHAINGIRHLLWDLNLFLDKSEFYILTFLVSSIIFLLLINFIKLYIY